MNRELQSQAVANPKRAKYLKYECLGKSSIFLKYRGISLIKEKDEGNEQGETK